MAEAAPLRAAIGRYAHTEALLADDVAAAELGLAFVDVPVISRAFAPMVRDARYDVSEMAIATFLMAKASGNPLVLLPVTLAARFQEPALLCRADGPVRGPADLAGRNIGVRAYSQTTGMWLRGVLQDRHGVAPETIRWVTFEDAHLPEYRDPPWAERAPAGADMTRMLREGTLDAAIFGNDVPDDPALRTVFPDPVAAGADFQAAFGFMPVNHLVTVQRDLARREPDRVARLARHFSAAATAASLPVGRDALAMPLRHAVEFCVAQGLLMRPLSLEDIWEGLPRQVA
ncbi:substrate-binding domain-containing protein [Neoroseomonas lacus]|uniref:4,5-dihydroxyphthalate decarboxylase n=1 Tax=Neoroseomonas lacus TaxID=287609 RepID=A0A917KXZ3_9PROT|nr:ABC transporter substrate-binding protein [Neoroseomonas lacus]GGJ30271.1 hypothetical protein GCM10011320_42240 [Neoroseomonas lacus]